MHCTAQNTINPAWATWAPSSLPDKSGSIISISWSTSPGSQTSFFCLKKPRETAEQTVPLYCLNETLKNISRMHQTTPPKDTETQQTSTNFVEKLCDFFYVRLNIILLLLLLFYNNFTVRKQTQYSYITFDGSQVLNHFPTSICFTIYEFKI